MAIAIYARKSIERENSISCDTQIEYCRMMIRPEERAEKVITFVDNGFSGGNVERDGFREMMKQIARGAVTKLIVYRLDRISRSLSDFVQILDTLKKHGVQFVSSQESFDTSSPYGEMIVKILMVFAEFERQSTIERVTQAYAHRSELGLYMGGRQPYGFTLIGTEIHGIKTKMLAPIETETEHLRYIFETYAVQGMTLRRLMDSLIRRGMMPEQGSWSTAKLSSILKNPIYVRADNSIYEYYSRRNCRIISDIAAFDGVHGAQLYGKTKHEAEDMSDMKLVIMSHEGVIPANIWLACQKKIAKNKQFGASVSNTTSWLGGKVFCKKCGRTMRVVKGSLRTDGSYTRYFGCTGKAVNRICDGVKVPVYAESLENMVYDLIEQKLETLHDVRRKVQEDYGSKLNHLKNRLSEIKTAQQRLVEMVLSDSLGEEMRKLLNDRAVALAQEHREICEKIEALNDGKSEIMRVAALSEKWKCASYEEKKAVAALLMDKILIEEDGTTEVVWNL